MKRALISAALIASAFVSASAFAQASGETRADVNAQLVQAEQSGQLMQQRSPNDFQAHQVAAQPATESRADVKSELAQAQAEGTLARQVAPNDQAFIATPTSANHGELTRAEVKHELAVARQAGLVPSNQTNYPYDFNRVNAAQQTALTQR